MSWKLIFSLALFGVVMGSLSLFGLTRYGVEPALWIISGIFIAFLTAKYAPGRVFMHGLWIGVFEGIFKSAVTLIGWDIYTANNDMSAFEGPSPLPVSFFTFLLGIVIGSVYGVILGLVSVFFRKLFVNKTSRANDSL